MKKNIVSGDLCHQFRREVGTIIEGEVELIMNHVVRQAIQYTKLLGR